MDPFGSGPGPGRAVARTVDARRTARARGARAIRTCAGEVKACIDV